MKNFNEDSIGALSPHLRVELRDILRTKAPLSSQSGVSYEKRGSMALCGDPRCCNSS